MAAARELGARPRTVPQGVRDADEARRVLQRLEEALATSGAGAVGEPLHQVRTAQAEPAAGAIAEQRSMLPVLNQALSELRAVTSIEELADAIPHQSVQLGYDRALFS